MGIRTLQYSVAPIDFLEPKSSFEAWGIAYLRARRTSSDFEIWVRSPVILRASAVGALSLNRSSFVVVIDWVLFL